MTASSSAPACPTCGQQGVRIAYGYPSEEMWEAEAAGQIVLGGCVVWDDMPNWRCPQGHDWREDEAAIDGIAAVTFGRPAFDSDEQSPSETAG